jgi:hypothetical protein
MAAELADVPRSVIDANSYMALGTADEAGSPWVSPVWFASEDYRNFHWVSSPDASTRGTWLPTRRWRSRSSTPRSRSAARRPST